MIPKIIVNSAHDCCPSAGYKDAFKEANKNTPPASYLEQCISGIAIGLLTSHCIFTNTEPTHCVAKCAMTGIITSGCTLTNCFSLTKLVHLDNELSLTTGLLRDCTVLKKTFVGDMRFPPDWIRMHRD